MRAALSALLVIAVSTVACAQAPDAKKDFEQKLKAEKAKTRRGHDFQTRSR